MIRIKENNLLLFYFCVFAVILVLSLNSFCQTPAMRRGVYQVSVVSITDGDSLRLAFNNGFQFNARLHGIDAPELAQPFGPECANVLVNLVQFTSLRIWIIAKDKFGRELVKLFDQNYNEINLQMLSAGCGWVVSPKRTERDRYKKAAVDAWKIRAGLWAQLAPEHPRSFRRRNP